MHATTPPVRDPISSLFLIDITNITNRRTATTRSISAVHSEKMHLFVDSMNRIYAYAEDTQLGIYVSNYYTTKNVGIHLLPVR